MEEDDSSHVVSLGSFVPFFARQSLPNGNGVNESGGDGVEGDGRRGKHIREDQVRLGLSLAIKGLVQELYDHPISHPSANISSTKTEDIRNKYEKEAEYWQRKEKGGKLCWD